MKEVFGPSDLTVSLHFTFYVFCTLHALISIVEQSQSMQVDSLGWSQTERCVPGTAASLVWSVRLLAVLGQSQPAAMAAHRKGCVLLLESSALQTSSPCADVHLGWGTSWKTVECPNLLELIRYKCQHYSSVTVNGSESQRQDLLTRLFGPPLCWICTGCSLFHEKNNILILYS